MKHIEKLACLALLIPMMTGCLPSMSRQPVGSTPLAVAERDWEGVWVADGTETYYLKAQNAQAGDFHMAWIDKGRNVLDLNKATLLLRQQGQATLFNVKPRGDGDEKDALFQFGRLVKDGNHIVAWSVRPEALRALAELSVIKAEFETNRNRVTATVIEGQGALAQRMAADDGWLLLDLEHPLVFVRQHATPQ